MARLRRPLGAWRLVDIVGADRRDRRQRTADRWPDTLLAVGLGRGVGRGPG